MLADSERQESCVFNDSESELVKGRVCDNGPLRQTYDRSQEDAEEEFPDGV
jgi:hypothetical protein